MGLLDGKVAIVTGAARGLGFGIAQAFCRAGAAVMLADVLSEGADSAAQLQSEGHRADFTRLDVTDAGAWEAIAARTVEQWGSLDILANNAGINRVVTIDDATIDDMRTVFEVNFFGAFLGMQTVIPHMKAAGGGSIINTASTATRKMYAVNAAYAPSKAALAALTKTSSIHLATTKSGIRVNSIHPGVFATELVMGKGEHSATKEMLDYFSSQIPMGRLGDPSEVGDMAVFLASDMARYVTGAEFFVDGGVTTG